MKCPNNICEGECLCGCEHTFMDLELEPPIRGDQKGSITIKCRRCNMGVYLPSNIVWGYKV